MSALKPSSVTYYIYAAKNLVENKGVGTWGNTTFGLSGLDAICISLKWNNGPTKWANKEKREIEDKGGITVIQLYQNQINPSSIITLDELMENKGFTFLEFSSTYVTEENASMQGPPYDIGTGIYLPKSIMAVVNGIYDLIIRDEKFKDGIYKEIGLSEISQHQVKMLYQLNSDTQLQDLLKARIALAVVSSIDAKTQLTDKEFGEEWHSGYTSIPLMSTFENDSDARGINGRMVEEIFEAFKSGNDEYLHSIYAELKLDGFIKMKDKFKENCVKDPDSVKAYIALTLLESRYRKTTLTDKQFGETWHRAYDFDGKQVHSYQNPHVFAMTMAEYQKHGIIHFVNTISRDILANRELLEKSNVMFGHLSIAAGYKRVESLLDDYQKEPFDSTKIL